MESVFSSYQEPNLGPQACAINAFTWEPDTMLTVPKITPKATQLTHHCEEHALEESTVRPDSWGSQADLCRGSGLAWSTQRIPSHPRDTQ